jgi:hypothetical protein
MSVVGPKSATKCAAAEFRMQKHQLVDLHIVSLNATWLAFSSRGLPSLNPKAPVDFVACPNNRIGAWPAVGGDQRFESTFLRAHTPNVPDCLN